MTHLLCLVVACIIPNAYAMDNSLDSSSSETNSSISQNIPKPPLLDITIFLSLKESHNTTTTIECPNAILKDPETVLNTILVTCPYLNTLNLSNTKLSSLGENTISIHHRWLQTLICKNNPITEVDFTALKKALPALKNFDASSCPLTHFGMHKYDDFRINPLSTIILHNTSLSDTVKKEIMKGSQQIAYDCTSERIYSRGVGGGVIPGCLVGLSVSFGLGISGISISGGALLGILISSLTGPMLLIGPAIAYPIIIGRTPREEREITRYIIDFGPNFKPSVEEITTPYQRFVRNFPEYFCSCKGRAAALEAAVIQEENETQNND